MIDSLLLGLLFVVVPVIPVCVLFYNRCLAEVRQERRADDAWDEYSDVEP